MKSPVLALAVCLLMSPLMGETQVNLKHGYFEHEGVRIHYLESGSGTPLILHHGFGGSADLFISRNILQPFSKRYRVIAIDARGRGDSDKPHEPSMYGEEMSEDIIRLLDHLGISKAHFLGYSMGVRVGAKALVNHPDRFHSAVLGGFSPVWDWTAKDQQDIEQRYKETQSSTNPRFAEQDTQALAASLLGFPELVVKKQELRALPFPILTFVGSEDAQLENLTRFKELKPEVELVILEGETHGSALSSSRLVTVASEFLERANPE